MINSKLITKNINQLRQEVAAHVAADTIIQGDYWNDRTKSGCFIGCLAKCNDPRVNEITYGLPVMLQRIAETIFEALPAADAKAFFAALPEAINCDGKDLTKVVWQFLAANLRSLSNCPAEIQAVINPVITGMDLLASGQEWNNATAWASAFAAAHAAHVANAAANAAFAAAHAAKSAAAHADHVANAAANAAANAITAASKANAAANAITANVATDDYVFARLQQRDLLLRLISEAPIVKAH